MLKNILNNPFKLFLFVIILFSLNFQRLAKFTGDNSKTIIFSDGLGYYAYLPAAFIYHDMNFGFQSEYENKYYEPGKRADFCSEIEGRKTDKYFCGVSVMLTPFFLLACVVSKIFGFEVDGYSWFFQISVCIAALFYLVCGFIFLRKLLRYYCNEKTAVFILFSFFFGTNLLYYTWMEPAMSHVYSFAAFSAFLYFVKKIFDGYNKRNIYWAMFFYGLIILVRPSNAVIILAVPFLAGGFTNFMNFCRHFFSSPKILITSFLTCASVVFVQLLVFYLESGHWFVYSYGGENFDFAHPEIMNVLFSYRKGLFIYTPLALVSLGGVIILLRNNIFSFFSVMALLGATVWIISSWWCWYYGGSYGNRAFVEYFSLFAVLLAILFHSLTKAISKIILSSLILLCISLNIFQTWQFYRVILPWDGMTKDRYWTIFLRTDDRFIGMFTPNSFVPEELKSDSAVVFKNDFDPAKEWFDMNTLSEENAHSGKHSSKIGGDVNKSVSFSKKITDVFPFPDSSCYVQVKLWAWIESNKTDAQIVISFEQDGKSYSWNTYYIANQIAEEKKWTSCIANVRIPKMMTPNDLVWVYILKGNKPVVYLDDFEISFLKKK